MESSDNNVSNRHNVLYKQPISCPWINAQPYPSTLNKNKAHEASISKPVLTTPVAAESTQAVNVCHSLTNTSNQFFYFLRLMQLFPETHPATLHTILTLCKNDFFCAVDKLLYAKRCKTLYNRNQLMFKKCTSSRLHPYCCRQEQCKNCTQNTSNLFAKDVSECCGLGSESSHFENEDNAKCKTAVGKFIHVNQENEKPVRNFDEICTQETQRQHCKLDVSSSLTTAKANDHASDVAEDLALSK